MGTINGLCNGGPLDGQIKECSGNYMGAEWTIKSESTFINKQGEEINNLRCKVHTYSKRWKRLANFEWYEWY